ncbi:MAG TPA: hypothetical protein VFC82_04360 [Actinomycetaceae bacterium]|nr:hypothetical protein [Actinomycetaceae bacterium]
MGYLLVALVIAAYLIWILVSARKPEEGFKSWVRSSVAGARHGRVRDEGPTDVDIEQLLTDDPSVPGYVTPEQLRDQFDGVRSSFTR